MARHQAEVQRISETVKAFHERGEKFRIYHGSTNSTRKNMMNKDSRKIVDTSTLNHVLHIDKEKQVALVEPNVPMDRLVEATLEHNLIPPVVMEFPGITVGGGYSGTSGESSSFKHGFFDRTLNSVEMVLADGSVTTLSETQNAELFRGAAGAVGTFGVTTLVELQLRPAKKYVETTYHPVSSTAEAIAKTKELADPDGDLDYVDGLLFSPTSGAIITGRLVDEQSPSHPLPIQRFSSASDPWFYMHAESTITNSPDPASPHKELIPLPEYLFRYDRGGFWVGRAAFSYFSPFVPFTRFTRWWLDDFLHTRMMYQALHSSGHTERMFVQDLAVPYDGAEAFIQYSDDRLNIWPLWLCPLKQSPQLSMHPHDTRHTGRGGEDTEAEQMLNIGLWGLGPPVREDFIRANRDIESKLKDLHGMRWLYAQTYHPAEEFWEDFDEGWYRDLRRKYGAEGLPDVHEKVRVGRDQATMTPSWAQWIGSFWPLPGLLGLRRAIQSRDYVKARESTWKEWVPRK
ncbi:FAD-binding domain-containing protein [Hortaea werneckii]|nr:FAD-binding domain-containing protein [Hortaea werneckii]